MYSNSKRLLDIFISLLAILLLSPLFLITMLILRFTAEGEVFYLQERIGRQEKPFRIFKFATMLKDSPNIGTGTITLKNDPRVTPVGRILRKTKLNELPQLFNVLLGQMSIVGPRPLLASHFYHYSEDIQQIIRQSKPGLTGIGSIVFRDEQFLVSQAQRPPKAFYKQFIVPYKGKLEQWYTQNASLKTDILLIFLTAWVILFHRSKLVFRIFKSLPPIPDELDLRKRSLPTVKNPA